jgi:hypothetical protein
MPHAMLSQACLFMHTELSSKFRAKMIHLFGHGLPARNYSCDVCGWFSFVISGRRSMSEKYFSDMIHDLGLGHHKDVTIAELFGSLSQKADPIFHSLYNMTVTSHQG